MSINPNQAKFSRDKIAFQNRVVETGCWRCCLNCLEWNVKAKICNRFKALPPPEVLTVSCEHYEWNIPF